jgi:hypothetical protein
MRVAQTLATVLAALIVPTMGAADPVSIVRDLRRASVTAVVSDGRVATSDEKTESPGDLLAPTALALRNGDTASSSAILTSGLTDPAHMWGTAQSASSMSVRGVGTAIGNAQFNVTFDLSEAAAFLFRGAFTASPLDTNGTGVAYGLWEASLSDGRGAPLFGRRGLGSDVMSEKGMLPSGRYTLWALAVSAAQNGPGTLASQAGFNFTLDLKPEAAVTPEPASMVLLGSGLLAIFGVARGRKRNSSSR